jgi:quinol monooxygenase YgiN
VLTSNCRYKDKAALGAHGGSQTFKDFQRTLAKEKLLSDFKVVYTKGVAGFSSRL